MTRLFFKEIPGRAKGRANEGDDRFCAALFRPSITENPEIQQIFPDFSITSGRKMPRAKLLRTADREIFVSSEATGAGILGMYSEHRQRCLARKDPVCGCRIPNLRALRVRDDPQGFTTTMVGPPSSGGSGSCPGSGSGLGSVISPPPSPGVGEGAGSSVGSGLGDGLGEGLGEGDGLGEGLGAGL